jgi:hypothetical protein
VNGEFTAASCPATWANVNARHLVDQVVLRGKYQASADRLFPASPMTPARTLRASAPCGEASRVVDQQTLEQVAKRYRAGGWPAEVERRRVHSAVQRPERRPATLAPLPFTVRTAFGVATAESYGATRWSFAA